MVFKKTFKRKFYKKKKYYKKRYNRTSIVPLIRTIAKTEAIK